MVTQSGYGEVEFRVFRPQAERVFLVGDFNGWNEHAQPMIRTEDGTWKAHLKLADGVHEFRYLADGEWYLDFLAFGLANCPSGFNSVVLVGVGAEPSVYVG